MKKESTPDSLNVFKNNYLTQIFLSCDLGCSAVLLDDDAHADDDDIIWMLMFSYIFQLLIELNFLGKIV